MRAGSEEVKLKVNEFSELNDMLYQVNVRCAETVDHFIFETIRPYAQNITRITISKGELIEAIEKQRPMKYKATVMKGEYPQIDKRCGRCAQKLYGKPKYCKNCGQAVKWNV